MFYTAFHHVLTAMSPNWVKRRQQIMLSFWALVNSSSQAKGCQSKNLSLKPVIFVYIFLPLINPWKHHIHILFFKTRNPLYSIPLRSYEKNSCRSMISFLFRLRFYKSYKNKEENEVTPILHCILFLTWKVSHGIVKQNWQI